MRTLGLGADLCPVCDRVWADLCPVCDPVWAGLRHSSHQPATRATQSTGQDHAASLLVNLVFYVPQLVLPETIKNAYVQLWANILGIQYGVFDLDSLEWFQMPPLPKVVSEAQEAQVLPKALRGVFWMDG